MNVFGRFMKQDGQGVLSASRVVPKKTQPEDLQSFRLMPTETIELWESKGRKYVTLKSKVVRGHYQTLERVNAITAYLKALHTKVKCV
jgi:hypothetical protein